jgi:hypothetical protein
MSGRRVAPGEVNRALTNQIACNEALLPGAGLRLAKRRLPPRRVPATGARAALLSASTQHAPASRRPRARVRPHKPCPRDASMDEQQSRRCAWRHRPAPLAARHGRDLAVWAAALSSLAHPFRACVRAHGLRPPPTAGAPANRVVLVRPGIFLLFCSVSARPLLRAGPLACGAKPAAIDRKLRGRRPAPSEPTRGRCRRRSRAARAGRGGARRPPTLVR